MDQKKYKILLLSSLKKTDVTVLKSTVNLARIMNADINMFYVKKPLEIVKKESHLSAMRIINKEYATIDTEIKKMIAPFRDGSGVTIQTDFVFGNVKKEIANYINEVNPDMIVIGKRKSNGFKFIGDKITEFVLKNYHGMVLIAANNNSLELKEDLKLGTLNFDEEALNLGFAKNFVEQTRLPLKSFKIVEKSTGQRTRAPQNNSKAGIDYVFEQNDNVLDNLSNYLSKNNIDLLLVNRNDKKGSSDFLKSQFKGLIDKSNVSMFLPGTEAYELN
ncbi:MAG: universal stress protein [Flavobacteriaceae bacterium]|nr:universal stress protein [Flavobacteriaceae bacterium]